LKEGEILKMRVFSDLYKYTVWAVIFKDGSQWIRMGCLWMSLEDWLKIGILKSNLLEFPDDGSKKSLEREAAFNFAKETLARM